MVNAVMTGLSTDGDISVGFQQQMPGGCSSCNQCGACGAVFDAVAKPVVNFMAPQERLHALVNEQLIYADQALNARELPPADFFKSSAILQELSKGLKKVRSEENAATGGHSLFSQLISLELEVIDPCVRSGCISQADKIVDALKNSNSCASPMKAAPFPAPKLAA